MHGLKWLWINDSKSRAFLLSKPLFIGRLEWYRFGIDICIINICVGTPGTCITSRHMVQGNSCRVLAMSLYNGVRDIRPMTHDISLSLDLTIELILISLWIKLICGFCCPRSSPYLSFHILYCSASAEAYTAWHTLFH